TLILPLLLSSAVIEAVHPAMPRQEEADNSPRRLCGAALMAWASEICTECLDKQGVEIGEILDQPINGIAAHCCTETGCSRSLIAAICC
ncbi:hypothetical protein PENTCL1PPCAC_202, partial [Pristionchus entomophagus]